ncbi:MAG TPA: hypothetical protein VIX86_12090 [Streptosporangiaceae bacterium]
MVLLGILYALLIAGLLVGGTWAWWLTGRSLPLSRHRARHRLDAQSALWRHPAARDRWPDGDEPAQLADAHSPGPARPAGPDDDPEFLRALERRIRGEEPGGLI